MYILLTLALMSPMLAATTETCRVVVLDLNSVALSTETQELLPLVTESLAQEVASVSGCKVISEADIKKLIELEADRQSCGSDTDSCLAEIGAALGAERVVATSVGMLGTEYLVQARLLDTQRSEVTMRVEERCSRQHEQLPLAARNAARRLFGYAALPYASAPASSSAPAAQTNPAPLWAGVGIAVVGLAVGVTGTVFAGIADAQLADATNTDKDTARVGGLFGVGAVGLGSLVTVAGVVLATLMLVGE